MSSCFGPVQPAASPATLVVVLLYMPIDRLEHGIGMETAYCKVRHDCLGLLWHRLSCHILQDLLVEGQAIEGAYTDDFCEEDVVENGIARWLVHPEPEDTGAEQSAKFHGYAHYR